MHEIICQLYGAQLADKLNIHYKEKKVMLQIWKLSYPITELYVCLNRE